METNYLISEAAHNGATIVGVQARPDQTIAQVLEDLDELESLLLTLGIPTLNRLVQKRSRLSAKHLIGAGKVDEIAILAKSSGAHLVVIDHSLSGPQVHNLGKAIGTQVLDRAAVILDIFAKHAKTNQAKTQVEIAQLEYLLPRLTRAWTHFGRQAGGGVKARGMGEKQIEIDRRRARERIHRLQKRLEQIKKEQKTQSKLRRNELKVSIVGYTNSGKTTIMGQLTRANTEGRDALFATLDASTRTIDPNTRPRILLSDTVGFIRSLPHSLIESFRSTLEEVLNADLLVHVVDISSPRYQLQMDTTEQVLSEIGAGDIPRILIFNKIDRIDEQHLAKILSRKFPGSMSLSAHNMDHIRELREHIFRYFETGFSKKLLRIPVHEVAQISTVHRQCVIVDENYDEPGYVLFTVRAPESTLLKLDRFTTKM